MSKPITPTEAHRHAMKVLKRAEAERNGLYLYRRRCTWSLTWQCRFRWSPSFQRHSWPDDGTWDCWWLWFCLERTVFDD